MADPHRETGQIDTPEVHDISDNIVLLDSDHAGNGITEGMLHHSLVDTKLDSTSVTYVIPTSEHSSVANTVSGSTLGLGLRSVSLEEYNIPSGDVSHGDIADIHRGIDQINGSENILANNSQPVLPTISTISISSNNREMSSAAHEVVLEESSISNSKELKSVFTTLPNSQIISISQQISNETANASLSQSEVTTNNTTIPLNPAKIYETSQIIDDQSQMELHTISQAEAMQVSSPRGISMTPEILQSVIQQVKAQQHLSQHSSIQPHSSQDTPESETGTQNNSVSFTLVSPNQQNSSAAPLGSSQNPIRIIQQGNRYTPMQQLSTEQLQQIMQVVQQQHTSTSKAQDNGGTVIFNPHTNTKIMYRVIYPSELHKSQASGQATYQVIKPVTLSQEQQTAAPNQKRPYKKRKEQAAQSSEAVSNGVDDDKDRGSGDAPELSKEEKEERKKHRPRTRSGRVSKPPKHMVQDYKHIHVLDWDEDYDDSDGGYSDLKQSDEESRSRQSELAEQEASPDLFQALGAGKPKNYKCQTCEKSYIGQAGLERHYRLAPEHRRSEDNGIIGQVHNGLFMDGEDSSKDTSIAQDGNSRNSDPGPEISKSNGLDNFSEDSNTQDSINSIGASSPVMRRGRGRGSYRGRWAHLKHNAHARRKNKLREFTKMCSDEDLMEVLFPRLVNCMSTWEFLLMKAEKGGSRPKVDVIYKEFEDLLRPLKKVCADYMKPVAEGEISSLNSYDQIIKVNDQNLASCLGLNVGSYKVEEMLPDDSNSFSSLHNKLSAASISLSSNTTTQDRNNASERNDTFQLDKILASGKRKYEATSPCKKDNIPMKKPCLMKAVSSSISPEQSFLSLNGLENIKSESVLLQTTSSIHPSPPSTHSLQSIVSQSSNYVKVENSLPPSTSHPNVSYLISTSNGKGPTATSQAFKSQLVPVVLNTGSSTNTVAVSSSQILPVVFNPQTSKGTVSTTTTGNKTGQISSLPLLLATPGSQFQGNTIFLASSNQTASQNILLKQSSKQPLQQQKPKFISSQHSSPTSKSQISLLGSMNKLNTNGTAKVAASTSSSIQRFDTNMKPAEVKVSRKLFHEATASSSVLPITTSSSLSSVPSSSSYVTSGQLNNTVLVTSPHKVKTEYDINNSTSVTSMLPSSTLPVGSSVSDNCSQIQIASVHSLANAREDLTNDLTRVVTSVNDVDLDSSFDISTGVLSSIGFSGDELSLNTSSDNPSIAVTLPNLGVNQVSSMINEIIAPSNTISNGIPLIPSKATGNDSSINHVGNTDSPFINGSSKEFPTISPPSLKLKDNILPGSQSSSSSFMSSSSDFIQLLSNKPSSPLMSSPCKDSTLNNVVTSVSFNLTSMDSSLPSQILKSEGTHPAIMDLGVLTFPDQSVEQLNGVTSTLHSSDVDGILPEQISQSDEAVNPLLELPHQLVGEDMSITAPAGEEDGQFLLTEGSNIYQTEDGTWFIQSADGNTYQLQGAQGLPMETVQALLSGNLDLNGDNPTDDAVQADVMH